MLFSEICSKEVVSICTGTRLGQVDDIEFDEKCTQIRKIIICARGFFNRDNDIAVDWCDIDTIGPDIILVHNEFERAPRPRKKLF